MAKRVSIFSELNDLMMLQPFRPFSIIMASGVRYEVTDPESILLFPTTVTIFSLARGGHAALHVRQISSIEAYERP